MMVANRKSTIFVIANCVSLAFKALSTGDVPTMIRLEYPQHSQFQNRTLLVEYFNISRITVVLEMPFRVDDIN